MSLKLIKGLVNYTQTYTSWPSWSLLQAGNPSLHGRILGCIKTPAPYILFSVECWQEQKGPCWSYDSLYDTVCLVTTLCRTPIALQTQFTLQLLTTSPPPVCGVNVYCCCGVTCFEEASPNSENTAQFRKKESFRGWEGKILWQNFMLLKEQPQIKFYLACNIIRVWK